MIVDARCVSAAQRVMLDVAARGLRAVGCAADRRPAAAPQAYGPDIDWDTVVFQAGLHGALGLMQEGVAAGAAVPAAAAGRIAALHRAGQQRAVGLCGELARLFDLLDGNGIPLIAIKGPLLAHRVYGNLGRRSCWDLDLLLPRGSVTAAAALLEANGFVPQERWDAHRTRRELRRNCEYNFDHPGRGVHVELHWDFVPRSIGLACDMNGIWRRAEAITFLGRPMRVLAPADELITLAVHHGAKHSYEQLRMVADIALCSAHTLERTTVDQLWRRAERAGVRRLLATGLLLARELLDAPLNADLVRRVAADPQVARSARRCAHNLLRFSGDPPEDGLNQLITYLQLRERPRDRLRYLPRAAAAVLTPSEHEQRLLPLPRALRAVHVIVRPLRLLSKYALKARRGSG
ncbi:MAG: hypothetical protein EA404_08595 [Spirochaetaceae bacterium]|nr:MAG: hypothetical protein EA404_08595 [Spirochaetaceae bacterium]